MVSALLGWLGATNLLSMALYILSVFLPVSSIPSVRKLVLQVYVAAILTTISGVLLIYGSYLIWKTSRWKGGLINILAGTLVPVPTYLYFTFFSQPILLGWLNPLGCFLLAPAILSGAISISLSKYVK